MTNPTTPNTGTPDNFGPDTVKLFVAYSVTTETTDDKDGEPLPVQPSTITVPVYIEIPDTDWPVTDARDEVADCLRLEGAVGVRFEGPGDLIDERLFPRDESLEPVYVVTDPEYTGIGGPFTATLERLREMFYMTDFVGSGDGLVVVDLERGPLLIGTVARLWRERRAGRTEPVPIVREGEVPPSDRTYVFVSAPLQRYRNSPDLQPTVQRMERSSDVIPYANGRALWSHVEVDWFALLGIERAIVAAREAVALVVGAQSYSGYLHYWRFVAGCPYDFRNPFGASSKPRTVKPDRNRR